MAEFPEAVREAVSEAKVKFLADIIIIFLTNIFVNTIIFFANIFVTIIIFASPNIYQG